MSEVRAYPSDRWPRVSKREAAELRAWARSAALEPFAGGARDAESFLGVRPAIALGVPKIAEPALDGRVAILLEEGLHRTALAIDLALVSVLIDRALGGDGEGLEGALGVPGEVERGVLAYTFARWIAGSGQHVAAILTTRGAMLAAIGEGPHVAWPLAIELGRARGTAALYAPSARAPNARARAPRFIGGLGAELVVIGGSARLDVEELAMLARGDVIVLDECTINLAGDRVGGSVEIHGARHLAARIEDGALRVERDDLGAAPTEGSVEGSKKQVEKLANAPVTLSLELARFTLPLSELAALAPGEIVRTGRPIGERVSLRAGDRTIAIGELVDVDGEIGVRVLEVAE